MHNFAKFNGVTREQVDELFPYQNYTWIWVPVDEIATIVEGLEGLKKIMVEGEN